MLAGASIEAISEGRIRRSRGPGHFDLRIIHDDLAAVPDAKLRTDLQRDSFFVTVTRYLPRLLKLGGQDFQHLNGGRLNE